MKATGAGSHSFNQATVIRAFTLYCRLSIHLQHKFSSEGKVYLSHLKETGAWIESHVLPLMHEQEENVLEQHIEVSQLIIQVRRFFIITSNGIDSSIHFFTIVFKCVIDMICMV
nr:condensin-2 complex subunit G2-like [Chrysemys picta bellii]